MSRRPWPWINSVLSVVVTPATTALINGSFPDVMRSTSFLVCRESFLDARGSIAAVSGASGAVHINRDSGDITCPDTRCCEQLRAGSHRSLTLSKESNLRDSETQKRKSCERTTKTAIWSPGFTRICQAFVGCTHVDFGSSSRVEMTNGSNVVSTCWSSCLSGVILLVSGVVDCYKPEIHVMATFIIFSLHKL